MKGSGMKLAEMFAEHDALTFEDRRAEVIAIVRSAADFAGADYGLRAIFDRMCASETEPEFDEAFDTLAASLSEATLRTLQTS
jgi:hypothetical protein